MIGEGVACIAIGWLAFWWLDHYVGLRRYLHARFRCVRNNDCLIAFDLRSEMP